MLKQKALQASQKGFTIVELLIVVVVIGVLAAIVINSFTKAQDQAKAAKVSNDLTVLKKAIMTARESSGKTLLSITGNGCTRCNCPYTNGDLTPYNTMPKTSSCWTGYSSTLDKIATAASTNLDQLKAGDPWGSPYAIDENEGESGGCGKDTIWSFGKSSNANGGTGLGNLQIQSFAPPCI